MTNPSMPAADQFLHLSEGRRLGYAEYGAPMGRPVLFFQCAPGSLRQVNADMAAATARQGVRLICAGLATQGLFRSWPG